MATTIKLKSSATPGSAPTTANVDLRELAMNVGDGKLYLKQRPDPLITDGSGDVIVDLHQRSVTEAVSDALALADARYLGISAKAADSNLLDGIDSASFLRSDQNDTTSGSLTIQGSLIPSVGNTTSNGINWPLNPGGGSGDGAYIRYYVESGENTKLVIGILNDGDDDIALHTSGGVTVNDNRVLTVADEGAGNGLDADLLDGQQGSYYLDTSATTQTKSGGLNVSGNVGIGTTNPQYTLDVYGDLNIKNDLYIDGILINLSSIDYGLITGAVDSSTDYGSIV